MQQFGPFPARNESFGEKTGEAFFPRGTLRHRVRAPFWIVKAAVPLLPAGAVIINTSSSLAYTPAADQMEYSMTKACLISFTKGLAKQLLSRGIRVNAVAPGPLITATP